jgi:hypothetical protein
MGFDIYGRHPTGKDGEYFRRSVWEWHPLADYACSVAPDITTKCTSWHDNSGDGLNARQAAALSRRLDDEVRSGRTGLYLRAHDQVRSDDDYSLDVEAVTKFAAFLRACGGFEIC